MLREVMLRMIKMLGRLQQGLGWNASNVGTSTTRRRLARRVLPLVHAGHFETELRRANCRHVTTRAATDYYNVKLIHIHLSKGGHPVPANLSINRCGGHGVPTLSGYELKRSATRARSAAIPNPNVTCSTVDILVPTPAREIR